MHGHNNRSVVSAACYSDQRGAGSGLWCSFKQSVSTQQAHCSAAWRKCKTQYLFNLPLSQ